MPQPYGRWDIIIRIRDSGGELRCAVQSISFTAET